MSLQAQTTVSVKPCVSNYSTLVSKEKLLVMAHGSGSHTFLTSLILKMIPSRIMQLFAQDLNLTQSHQCSKCSRHSLTIQAWIASFLMNLISERSGSSSRALRSLLTSNGMRTGSRSRKKQTSQFTSSGSRMC